MLKTCFFLFSLFLIIHCEDELQKEKDPPIVTTSLGKIRGFYKKSAKREWFSAFEGIPYAKPPIGERRFEPPESVASWKGVWEANTLVECPQTEFGRFKVIGGEEDCLYINVYVPGETLNPKANLDVIVHIHGGLFLYGSGHSYSHPEYFMDENVIFVTFNYRLGIFGFLSTNDNVVPGNNGLKDQVLALKWVQEHISNFGGNPECVTITGLSTGASSVQYHYISDLSRGLFHRGFSQSGVALNSFALQERPLQKAKQLAEAVGCPSGGSTVLVECLKQRNFRHLLGTMSQFFGYKFLPLVPFGPVLENGKKPFLSKNPYFLLKTGKVQDLPWLVSTVSHEGLFPANFIKSDISNIDENFQDLGPYLFDFSDSMSTQTWKEISLQIKNFYLKDEKLTKDNFDRFSQMFTDRFLADVESAIKLQSKVNKSPVYYYQFGYPGDFNKDKTVAHSEDGQYFFYNMYNRQPSADEVKMKETLMDMLITFAKSGKPRFGDLNWDPVEFPNINILNITTVEIEKNQQKNVENLGPRKFWTSLGFLENQNLILAKDEL